MPTVKGVKATDEGEMQLASGKIVTRYTLEFVVWADNATQGAAEIRATEGLPLVGYTAYNHNLEADLNAVCVSKRARRRAKHPRIWDVSCNFDSSPDSQTEENENNQGPPADRPAIESWEIEYGEAVLEEDYSDPPKLVLTPCGEKFDPPLTQRVVLPVLVIKRNEPAFGGAATILQYAEHANESAFRGAPPGSVQMIGPTATRTYEEGIPSWEVTYRLRFSPQGYDAHVLNQGTYYWETPGDPDTKRSFLTKDGVPFIGNLAADGTKAEPDSETFSDFRKLPRVDFGPLML